MGCPARNRFPAFLPNTFSARSTTAAFVLPTSVSKVEAGSDGPSRPIKSTIASTGVASTTNWLPRTASAGSTNPFSIAPHCFAFFSADSRSQPTIIPANFRFRSASANDPPISPVPTIVICRIGIKESHHGDTETRRKKLQYLTCLRGKLPDRMMQNQVELSQLRFSVSLCLCGEKGLSDFSSHRWRNHPQLIHQLGKLLRKQRLRSIRPGVVRVAMHFNQQRIRPGGHRRSRHRRNLVASPRPVRRVRRHRQMRQLVNNRNRGNIHRVPRVSLKRPNPALAQNHAIMYSADNRSSSKVAAIPRFTSTGFRTFPNSRSRLKFCMFRAPSWRISTYGSIIGICEISITSLITSSLNFSPASRSNFSASSPCP